VGHVRDQTNRFSQVAPPEPDDIVALPKADSSQGQHLREVGAEALRQGAVALVVMAGGLATRMGSIVKALVEVLPGQSFLDLRLAGQRSSLRLYGKSTPLWLMTSDATESAIRAALGSQIDDVNVAVFPQYVSLRLTPEGRLFYDADGNPSLHPTGHGDLPDTLRASGLLQRFLDHGGRYVWIANLDNLGATVDPLVLGWHMTHGDALTVEVVKKQGDKGGIPVRYRGKSMICEDFRLPRDFDAAQVDVFNTNTFVINADVLATYQEPWTYCEVEKKVGDQIAIQRERLIGELTCHLPTRFLRVPREGENARFLPVKSQEDLLQMRSGIETVARNRGMLPEAYLLPHGENRERQ